MHIAVLAAAFIALVASSAAADAQSPPAAPPPAAASTVAPPSPAGRQYLLNRLTGGMTLERYLTAMRTEFARQDADANGVLDQTDLDFHTKMAEANMRLVYVMQIMAADLDGDGFVTEQELRQKLQYDQRRNSMRPVDTAQQDRIVDQNIRRLMEADADKDGRISMKEAMDFPKSQAGYAQQMESSRAMMRQMLALASDGKTSLVLTDVETTATAYFRSVDKDGNGTISLDEHDAERQAVNRERAEAPRPVVSETLPAGCELPKASDAAKVVLLSGYETQSLSTAALGSQDDVTGVGNVVVESGTEPLYIVISSYRPTIWRFYGSLERIERVVVMGNQPMRRGGGRQRNASGVTGLSSDRVTFPEYAGCVRYFSSAPSVDASQMGGLVKATVGKSPDTIAAKYAMIAFNVPSGKVDTIGGDRAPGLTIVQNGLSYTLKDGTVTVVKPDQSLSSELDRFSPGGVVAIDAKSVVASVPVTPYEVLPQQAGLIQLVDSGALTRNGGDFMINRKIRMPAGLNGAHAVRFLLRRGVPEPDGDYGHSPVISEETGKPVQPPKG
jgi:Ca2+-binding EF-hand superfamily protein